MPLRPAGVLAACALVAAGAGLRTDAKAHPQRMFVTVRDSSGNLIRSLQPADFVVVEGGKPREVTSATLATALRARVALLVDNGFVAGGTVTPLRTALNGFLSVLAAEDEVAVGTLSPQFRVRVKPTSDRLQLTDAVNSLFAAATSGTALLDGVLEMDDRFVKPAYDRWGVFVIVTSDSPEVSGRPLEDFNRRIRELGLRGARAHAVVIELSSQARGNEPELSRALTQSTGGSYDSIATITALPDKMKAIGADIANTKKRAADEYVIEFMRETDNAPVDVSVKAAGAHVRVSMTP